VLALFHLEWSLLNIRSGPFWFSYGQRNVSYSTMRKFDVTCPKRRAGYRRIELVTSICRACALEDRERREQWLSWAKIWNQFSGEQPRYSLEENEQQTAQVT
jgi:hypothetical protein